MGNIFMCIVIFIGISLGERLSAYIHGGYASSIFSIAKLLIIVMFIGSFLRACGIL